MPALRSDTWRINVVVAGRDLGTWDKFDGGEVAADENKYRPGALQQPVSLGGTALTGNVTVQRLLYGEDDVHWLMGQAGRAAMSVSCSPLDADGNAYGRPRVYRGVLQTVTPPGIDSESSDAALLSLEMSPAGGVG